MIQTTQILGIFGDTIATLKAIIFIMIIIGLIFLCYYIKEFRPVIAVIICVLILAGGVGATVQNVKYFSATNKTIGEVLNSTFKSIQVVNRNENEFELVSPGFKQSESDENTWVCEYQFAQVADLDLKTQKYTLLLNDYRMFKNIQTDKKISSKFVYTFYDNDNQPIMTDTLDIIFVFNEKNTQVRLQTQGGEQAKELWKAFEKKNGIKITFDNSNVDEIYFG